MSSFAELHQKLLELGSGFPRGCKAGGEACVIQQMMLAARRGWCSCRVKRQPHIDEAVIRKVLAALGVGDENVKIEFDSDTQYYLLELI